MIGSLLPVFFEHGRSESSSSSRASPKPREGRFLDSYCLLLRPKIALTRSEDEDDGRRSAPKFVTHSLRELWLPKLREGSENSNSAIILGRRQIRMAGTTLSFHALNAEPIVREGRR